MKALYTEENKDCGLGKTEPSVHLCVWVCV